MLTIYSILFYMFYFKLFYVSCNILLGGVDAMGQNDVYFVSDGSFFESIFGYLLLTYKEINE